MEAQKTMAPADAFSVGWGRRMTRNRLSSTTAGKRKAIRMILTATDQGTTKPGSRRRAA
jgi:hypothetical protein